MARFEVHIPAGEPGGINVTLCVDADNWMAALKSGMQKLGEQGASAQNVLVDVQDDNSIHVTEARTGRVFRIRELSEDEAANARLKHAAGSAPLRADPPLPSSAAQGPLAPAAAAAALDVARPDTAKTLLDLPAAVEAPSAPATATEVDRVRAVATARTKSQPKLKPTDPDQVVELETPTLPVVGAIGRSQPPKREARQEVEDLLSSVFERVQDIYSRKSASDALYFLLDLALEIIPAESGTVYRADAGSGDLSFAAVRGPKAQELLRTGLVVPAGTGIAGFCTIEGVSVAVSDVEKNPHFYSAISEKLKYQTRSMLCAPMMTHGRAFGCFQLLNKRSGNLFADHEVGVLSYIAHQAALYLNARE